MDLHLPPPRQVANAVLSNPSAAALVALAEPILLDIAGAERKPSLVSLNLDLAHDGKAGDAVRVTAWVERATRTLVFAAAEIRLRSDESLIAAAQAVIKVSAP